MNNSTFIRILAGLGVIAVGLGALLGSLNIIDFGGLFAIYWPVLVIAAGILVLLSDPKRQYAWALLLVVFGTLWQLRTLEIVDFNVWTLFWPLVLIAVGWAILFNKSGPKVLSGRDANDLSAILGGIDAKVDSDDYTGGSSTTILGGGTIDLRNATIKKEATIKIFTLLGGLEIKVPEGWHIKSSVLPVLGGVEDKTAATSSKTAPVLNIVGTAILGGIEIRHWMGV